MTALKPHRRRQATSRQRGRPVRPAGLLTVIRSWPTLSPTARRAITNIVATTSSMQTAASSPPLAVVPPRSTNPKIQALFDLLAPDECLLFGTRWFWSGREGDEFIQGRPDNSLGNVTRFDGVTLSEQDAAGQWRIIRTVAAEPE